MPVTSDDEVNEEASPEGRAHRLAQPPRAEEATGEPTGADDPSRRQPSSPAGRKLTGDHPGAGHPSQAELITLERLYRSHYEATVRLARLLAGDHHRAEELAQEAFVRVAGRLGQIDNPGGYLRTVLVNLCRDQARRRHTVERHPEPVPEAVAPPDLPPDLDEIWQAVQALPDRQRDALVLRYWADLPAAEIGRLLGVRAGSARSLIHRGLSSLKEVLSDER